MHGLASAELKPRLKRLNLLGGPVDPDAINVNLTIASSTPTLELGHPLFWKLLWCGDQQY